MIERLLSINRALRNVLVFFAGLALFFKLTETKEKEREVRTSDEGFQIKEFDDIW